MSALLIPIAVLAFALNAAVTRAFQLKFPEKRALLRLYQALFCLTASVSFAVGQFASGASFTLGLSELASGALFGAFFYLAIVGASTCYEIGSMSLTSIITNMSLFIPLVYSCAVLGDRLTVLRTVGIVLIVVTMLLAVERKPNGEDGGTSAKWFIVVLIAFAANGVTAVIQKHYVVNAEIDRSLVFMAVAYFTSALMFAVNAGFTQRKTREAIPREPFILIAAALVSGLGSFGGNALLGYLCDKVNSTILYPCINGGLCIVSALASFALFGEKPTRRKLTAISVGVIAIVLLNL